MSERTIRDSKLWLAARISVVLVITAALGFGTYMYLYLYGTPSLVSRLLARPVVEPSEEEYAVFSAFVNEFFSSEQPFRADQSIAAGTVVYIAEDTLLFSLPPPDIAFLDPKEMEQDFGRQNRRSWRLQPLFHTTIATKLVTSVTAHEAASYGAQELFASNSADQSWLPHASPRSPFPETQQASGVLQLSLVGFSLSRRLAVLEYIYRCGVLCGQSGSVVLRKSDGQWLVRNFDSTSVY